MVYKMISVYWFGNNTSYKGKLQNDRITNLDRAIFLRDLTLGAREGMFDGWI